MGGRGEYQPFATASESSRSSSTDHTRRDFWPLAVGSRTGPADGWLV